MALLLLFDGVSPDSPIASSKTTPAGRGRTPHFCWMGIGLQTPTWSPAILWDDPLPVGRDECPGFLFGFLKHHHPSGMLGHLVMVVCEVSDPHSIQPLWAWVGLDHSPFCGAIFYCLKVFCFTELPFSGPLTRENRSLFWLFPLLYWHSDIIGFFNSKSGIYEAKKTLKNSLLCLFCLLLICLPLSNFQYLPMLLIYNVQGFWVVFNRTNREAMSTLSFQKQNSNTFDFKMKKLKPWVRMHS